MKARAALELQAKEARQQAPTTKDAFAIHKAKRAEQAREEVSTNISTLIPTVSLFTGLPPITAEELKATALANVASLIKSQSMQDSALVNAKAAAWDLLEKRGLKPASLLVDSAPEAAAKKEEVEVPTAKVRTMFG
jgi:sRNA-binding protein